MIGVIITHVRNEEGLIRGWITHHEALVKKIILIDYQSSDRTVDIAKEFACVEIQQSVDEKFEAVGCDRQVKAIEALYPNDLKIALTITEYLCVSGEGKNISFELSNDISRLRAKVLVNLIGDQVQTIWEDEINYGKGFALGLSTLWPVRQRFIHRTKTLEYQVGRHELNGKSVEFIDRNVAWIEWRAFNNFDQGSIIRRQEISRNIPKTDHTGCCAFQHRLNKKEIIGQFEFYKSQANSAICWRLIFRYLNTRNIFTRVLKRCLYIYYMFIMTILAKKK
jgi:hypothetical protein